MCGFLACHPLWGQAPATRSKPRPGWGAYQVILWSTGAPAKPGAWLERIREAGFTGEACPVNGDCGRFAPAGLTFYLENLFSELAFTGSRRALYDADWKAYTASGDTRYLVRRPCLDDPAFWEQIAPRLESIVRRHAAQAPLLYDLRDEPSIGSLISPMDYCFCPYTLQAFRNWLKKQYGSLDALNREWGTSFANWDAVKPSTTFEIKRREKAALAAGRPENYASWADHRAYMDESFAAALEKMRAMIRRLDPHTPVGIAGVQMPSAWGGYDLWRLSRAVDWMEPYDIGNSRAILGSFLPPEAPVLATYFGSDLPALRRTAWKRLLDGDRGAIIWDDEKSRVIQKSAGDMPVTRRGTDLRGLFQEIRAAAANRSKMRPVSDRIAIHYSQASIRAHWMFDSRKDGNTWFRRLASYEREHSGILQVRDSFVRVVEDLGLTPEFVSYEQIENGELLNRGYRVLLLPQSVAMSAAECRRVEEFVKAGGVAIADNMAATMDEHGRRLPSGQLDELFGVRQSPGWKAEGERGLLSVFRRSGPQEPIVWDSGLEVRGGARRGSIPSAPMIVEHAVGRGRTFYLNMDMHGYREWRDTWPQGAKYLEAFDRMFGSAGVSAPVKVQGARTVQVRRFAGEGVEYTALLQDPSGGEAAKNARTARIHVVLAKPSRVRQGTRDFGVVRELDLDLDASTPAILELRTP